MTNITDICLCMVPVWQVSVLRLHTNLIDFGVWVLCIRAHKKLPYVGQLIAWEHDEVPL